MPLVPGPPKDDRIQVMSGVANQRSTGYGLWKEGKDCDDKRFSA
jgi:hypothetical protein